MTDDVLECSSDSLNWSSAGWDENSSMFCAEQAKYHSLCKDSAEIVVGVVTVLDAAAVVVVVVLETFRCERWKRIESALFEN